MYNNERYYGSTCHLINEKIDSGQILDVRFFDIDRGDNVESLWEKTEENLLIMFRDFCMGLDEPEYLSMKMEQNVNYKWEGKANKMKQVDKLQEVPLNCTEKELKNKSRNLGKDNVVASQKAGK